jgi:hypothetical protein
MAQGKAAGLLLRQAQVAQHKLALLSAQATGAAGAPSVMAVEARWLPPSSLRGVAARTMRHGPRR